MDISSLMMATLAVILLVGDDVNASSWKSKEHRYNYRSKYFFVMWKKERKIPT